MTGSLGEWLHSHDGLVTLVHVGVFFTLLVGCTPRLVEAFRQQDLRLRWFLGAAALVAAAVSGFWIPAFSGFEALGHEASYLECFAGTSMDGSGPVSPSNSQGWEPFVTYPLVRWSYWLLGAVVGREEVGWLLAFNIAVRSLAVVWIGWLASALSGRAVVGAAAATILVLHPWHAFWGASIYNVAMPYMFASFALLLAVLSWRSGSGLLLAAAASSGVLVMAARVEWAILAPSLLLLLIGLGPSWGRASQTATLRFWVPAAVIAVLGALSVLLSGGQLTEQGGYHGVGGYFQTLARQAWILDLIEPFHTPWTLLSAAAGLVVMKRMLPGGTRAAIGLLAFVLFGYLALTTFNDFSYRHGLLPGIGLVLLASLLAVPIAEARGSARIVAGLLLVALLVSAALGIERVGNRYYLSQDDFFAQHEGFQGDELPAAEIESGACFVITDNERLWQTKRVRVVLGDKTTAQFLHLSEQDSWQFAAQAQRTLEQLVSGDDEVAGEFAERLQPLVAKAVEGDGVGAGEIGVEIRGLAGSHFNLMDPGEAVTHWRDFDGCVLWLFDNAGYRYDGLAVMSRVTKLQNWFSWDYRGWARLQEGEVLIYRMQQPPWGISDDEPIPETEFRLPGQEDPEDEDGEHAPSGVDSVP